MDKSNITPGEWKPSFVSGVCIGIEVEIQPGYCQVLVNTILPDSDREYEKEKGEILANINVMAASPDLLDACRQLLWSLENNDDQELINAKKSAVLAIKKALGK